MGRKSKRNKIENPEIEGEVFDAESGERIEAQPAEPDEPEPRSEPEPVPVTSNFAESDEPEPEPAPRPERRGRPKGSRGKRKQDREQQESPENLAKLLLGVHQMLAAVTSAPELLLTEGEAQQMGSAIAEVNALYGQSSWISPEVRAWANLTIAGLIVYGPRVKAIRLRLAREAKGEDQRPIEVTPIRSATAASTATH